MTFSGRGRVRGGRGRGRGKPHAGRGAGGSTTAKLQGLFPALGENVFTYGEKGSADQIKTTQEKIVQYVGIQYVNDIRTEVLNQTEFIIPKPEHSQETLDEHDNHVKKIEIRYNITKNAMESKKVVLERLSKGRNDVAGAANALIELTKLENTMEEAEDAIDK